MRFFWTLMVAAGCQPGGLVSPDATDGPPDVPPHAQGLFVTWRSDPMLPGVVSDKITVLDAVFQMESFEVVSDAGGSATTRSRYLLTWTAAGGPRQEAFPSAPVGVYSKVSISLMSGSFSDYSTRIRGTWRDSAATLPVPYVIEDRMSLSFAIDCNETLPAAGMATLALKVDLRDALNQIDFKSIDPEEGVIEVKDQDVAGFHARLDRAFKLDE